ncbi:hypothetical protein DSM112329_02696 [Paraconexibacter sp. AEG42_29]|uniref:Universal stress protein n=1 Tax=Paraconexibacter sp. AEG42_29 TaxID=2997339 RepID=A0AAU7AVU3_9ACTN
MRAALPSPVPPAAAYDDVRRILVVANETAGSEVLHDLVLGAVGGGRESEVFLIVPVLHDGLLRVPSHVARTPFGTHDAAARLRAAVDELLAEGVPTSGRLVHVDPLHAISQALRDFPADLVVIATHPASRSAWLAHDVVDRAARAFGLPVAHVVVDDLALEPVA